MWKCIFGTLGLVLGGLAGLATAFFGVGGVVESMRSSVAILVCALLGGVMGMIVGAFVGWRLDKRRNTRDQRHHRTWKSILGTLGLALGGLAGVAALRAWYAFDPKALRQALNARAFFRELDDVDHFYMQLSVTIVILALLGAVMGQIMGILLG